jgi:hypothetical protein
MECNYFLQGNCRFGDRCRYLHPSPDQLRSGGSTLATHPTHNDNKDYSEFDNSDYHRSTAENKEIYEDYSESSIPDYHEPPLYQTSTSTASSEAKTTFESDPTDNIDIDTEERDQLCDDIANFLYSEDVVGIRDKKTQASLEHRLGSMVENYTNQAKFWEELDISIDHLVISHKALKALFREFDTEFPHDLRPNLTRAISWCVEIGLYASWKAIAKAIMDHNVDPGDKELFVNRLAGDDSPRILAEAYEFGFQDSRLTHAIITMQRLRRERAEFATIKDFEKKHHQRESHWERKMIHMTNFSDDIVLHSAYGDEGNAAGEGSLWTMDNRLEFNIVRWNRKLIPKFIMNSIYTKQLLSDGYDMSDGVDMCINGEEHGERRDEYFSICELIQSKKEQMLSRNKDYLLEDDSLAKIKMLISISGEGRLREFKNTERDVLKFIDIKINEPEETIFSVDGCETPVARSIANRIHHSKNAVLCDVFEVLPKCLSSYGRDILTKFKNVELDRLEAKGVRKWATNIIVDSCDSIAEAARDKDRITGKKIELFLRGGSNDKVMEFLRGYLSEAQKKVKKGEVVYEYYVHESFTVKGVTAL